MRLTQSEVIFPRIIQCVCERAGLAILAPLVPMLTIGPFRRLQNMFRKSQK